MGHIELSRWADLVVVAPATADLIAKAANGLADDLASTTLLATDKPVLLAPAMNVRMWLHPAVQAQSSATASTADGVALRRARRGRDGLRRVRPRPHGRARGDLRRRSRACWPGPTAGRWPAARRALVTAGPTFEPIDPVRGLTNRSSGKQGYAIAEALAALGARGDAGVRPRGPAAPAGVDRVSVETAREMQAACEAALPADIAV